MVVRYKRGRKHLNHTYHHDWKKRMFESRTSETKLKNEKGESNLIAIESVLWTYSQTSPNFEKGR